MISGNYQTNAANPGFPSRDANTGKTCPISETTETEKFLPEERLKSSNDQKWLQSRSATPSTVSGNLSRSANNDEDSQVEKALSLYIDKREIQPIYLETLKHIIASEKIPLSEIPLVDLQNMLRSLNFSKVSKDDERFNEYNIKLIKTGAVLFTWTALNGTSIFNGNNHPSKINYVEHIIKTAKDLEKSNHPVLVIYSNKGMTKECIQEMERYFADESNIITLCQEIDLGLSFTGKSSLHQNDHMRLEIITSQDKVLKKAAEKARTFMKTSASNGLTACQASSLIYTDMDNHFISSLPGYLMAFDGVIDAAILRRWAIKNIKQYPALNLLKEVENQSILLNHPEEKITDLKQNAISKINKLLEYSKNHLSTDQPPESILTLVKELIELAAMIRRNKLSQTIDTLKNASLQDELDIIAGNPDILNEIDFFHGDNGFIVCSSPDNTKLKKAFEISSNKFVTKLNFHFRENKEYSGSATFYNPHHRKANSLAGYQLIDSIIIGHDGTWSSKARSFTINCSINEKKIRTWLDRNFISMFDMIDGFNNDNRIEILSIELPDAINE